jgi:hypothetical protein
LTPGFSRVVEGADFSNRFSGFPRAAKRLKRFRLIHSFGTQLKLGVNEICTVMGV